MLVALQSLSFKETLDPCTILNLNNTVQFKTCWCGCPWPTIMFCFGIQ